MLPHLSYSIIFRCFLLCCLSSILCIQLWYNIQTAIDDNKHPTSYNQTNVTSINTNITLSDDLPLVQITNSCMTLFNLCCVIGLWTLLLLNCQCNGCVKQTSILPRKNTPVKDNSWVWEYSDQFLDKRVNIVSLIGEDPDDPDCLKQVVCYIGEN